MASYELKNPTPVTRNRQTMKHIILLLSLITLSIWMSIFSIDDRLHIIACDVGQGDAILIQKASTQVLIDSGPGTKVLDCLGKYMPFWDKEIELAISTHVDKDHSGGFVDVMRAYEVKNFLTNDLNNPNFSTQTVEVLRKAAKNIIIPKKGMVIGLGMIQLDILHPEDGEFRVNNFQLSKNTNDTSIVTLLRYAQFKAIFMGDLELNISERLFEDSKIGTVDYIKVSHHGSKNGTSEKLLDLLRPKVAVISVGKNSYGHPNESVLKILESYGLSVRRTDQEGDVDYEVK